MSPIGGKIRQLREMHDLTQRELATVIGISDKAVSAWENGKKTPRMPVIKKLADYFGVTTGELVDDTVSEPEERLMPFTVAQLCITWCCTPEDIIKELNVSEKRAAELRNGAQLTEGETYLLTPRFNTPFPRNVLRDPANSACNIVPLPHTASRRIPVLGRVPAGIPIEAVTDIVEEIELSGHFAQDGQEYFGLLVMGDSMLPEYRDGDVVILRMQSTAETGDDVVAYIGLDDATLKRLTVTESGIQLRPLNPAYAIRTFTNDEIRKLPVTIAGVVVEQRRLRRR